jgi:hypothetical protein
MENINTADINSIEQLRLTMGSLDKDSDENAIRTAFKAIADCIMKHLVISTGDGKSQYRIIDFEFYYYNQNHQDITVHPRNSEPLCWYINDFGGIDLNFKSRIKECFYMDKDKMKFKYILDSDSYFGGVLLRQVKCIKGDYQECVFDGPLKVAQLFRNISAYSHKEQVFPVLEYEENPLPPLEFKEGKRLNLLGSAKKFGADAMYDIKAKNNFQDFYVIQSDKDETDKIKKLSNALKTFDKADYRYSIK